jgi:hypothetical protein
MQLSKTKYSYQIKEIIMKNQYKTQINTVKQHVKKNIGKLLDTYNGKMYFK